MKRTIIQSGVMVLAILAISVGVKAQSAQQYRADIPFDFEARGQSHPAGKYRVGSLSTNGPGAIGLHDVQSGKVRILGVTADQGNNNWDKPGTLTFLKVGGRYILSEISTATFAMKMKGTETYVRDAGAVASAARTVKVSLN